MDERHPAPAQPPAMQRLGIAFLTWRRYVQKRVTAHGITLKQAFVLNRLAGREYLLPSQIARLLFCDRPTATVVVKNMEKRGWVRRERDTADRRQMRVTLTEAGREKLAALRERVWDPLESTVDPLGCFDRDEIEVLDGLLGRLVKHLRQLE